MSGVTDPAPAIGGPVAAATPGGSIYDLGYRGYEGPRLGRPHAIRALFLHTLRVCYGVGRGGRAKLAPIILGAFATIPAIIAVGALALLREAGAPGELADASPIRHDTYYGVITTLVVLFCAAQVPETLGRDQRYSLLALYFSRALRPVDYALARFAGIVAAILAFVLVPQAVIFFGLILSAADVARALADEVAFLPAILGQGLLTALVLGGVSAVVSAFTPRRAYAIVAIIVVLAVTPIVSALTIELGTRGLATVLALLSPPDILDATNAWLFASFPTSDVVRQADVPLSTFTIAAIILSVACLAVLAWRYRRIAA